MANSNESKIIVLRCYGRPGKNNDIEGYYAVCIDLNLVTWRTSPSEAHKSLIEAIEGYIETISEVAESFQEFESLLNRPAPFVPYGATYHLIALRSAFSRNDSNKYRPSLYDNPVEVPAFG